MFVICHMLPAWPCLYQRTHRHTRTNLVWLIWSINTSGWLLPVLLGLVKVFLGTLVLFVRSSCLRCISFFVNLPLLFLCPGWVLLSRLFGTASCQSPLGVSVLVFCGLVLAYSNIFCPGHNCFGML